MYSRHRSLHQHCPKLAAEERTVSMPCRWYRLHGPVFREENASGRMMWDLYFSFAFLFLPFGGETWPTFDFLNVTKNRQLSRMEFYLSITGSHSFKILTCSIQLRPRAVSMLQFGWFRRLNLCQHRADAEFDRCNSKSTSATSRSFAGSPGETHSNFPVTPARVEFLAQLIETQTGSVDRFTGVLIVESFRLLSFQRPETHITRLTNNHHLKNRPSDSILHRRSLTVLVSVWLSIALRLSLDRGSWCDSWSRVWSLTCTCSYGRWRTTGFADHRTNRRCPLKEREKAVDVIDTALRWYELISNDKFTSLSASFD